MDALWYYVVVFTVYSVLGWALDTAYTRVREGHWAKRGFHHGPFYMLYGWGALVSLLLFNEYSPAYIVIPAALLYSGIIEYTGSVVLEKIGLTYWDYSKNVLNLNGRICLESISLFTVGIMAILYVFHPFLQDWLSDVPHVVIMLTGVLAFLYLFVWGAVRIVIQYRYYQRHKVIRNQAYDIPEQ